MKETLFLLKFELTKFWALCMSDLNDGVAEPIFHYLYFVANERDEVSFVGLKYFVYKLMSFRYFIK